MKEQSTFKYECQYQSQGYDRVIGIDEAGRGPLAGPVVACAATLRTSDVQAEKSLFGHPMSKLIRDSKTLSEKQREELFDFIHEHFYVGIGICDHKTIDRINILEATYLAMKKAISSVTRNVERETSDASVASRFMLHDARNIILVDGNKVIPNCSYEQQAVIGGDKIVKSISAASIIAKVTRDRIMKEMHEKYPEYDFLKHKGYGTKLHMDMIRKHGGCEIHRKSFRPFV
jgi:ribonuclease HII